MKDKLQNLVIGSIIFLDITTDRVNDGINKISKFFSTISKIISLLK